MQIKNVKFIPLSCLILILIAYTGMRCVIKLPAIKGTVSGYAERTTMPTQSWVQDQISSDFQASCSI